MESLILKSSPVCSGIIWKHVVKTFFGRIDEIDIDIPGYERWFGNDSVDKILMTGRLTEAKQIGPLYHYTSLQQAIKIMNAGELKGNEARKDATGFYRISFTRNPNYHKTVGLMPTTGDIRFTLDGDKISNNYKMRPIKGGLASYDATRQYNDESEEIVLANQFPLYHFLQRVDINTDQVGRGSDELHVSAVNTMAKKQNVPVGTIGTGWRAEPIQRTESTRFGLVGFSKYIFEGPNDWAIWFDPRTGQHMKKSWHGVSDHKDMLAKNPEWFKHVVDSGQHGPTTDAVDSGYIRGVFFGNSRDLNIQTYSSEGVADFIRTIYKEFRRIDSVYIDSHEGYTNRSLTGDEIDNIVTTGKLPKGYFQESILTELKHSELENLVATIDAGENIYEWMQINGWADIGDSGTSYSNVYGKSSSPWVIKVLRNAAAMQGDENSRCGLQWLRLANKNHGSNPHLPKVAFVKSIKSDDYAGGGRTYIAVMEKLVPAKKINWRKGFGINTKLDAHHAATLLRLDVARAGDEDLEKENIETVLNFYPALNDKVSNAHGVRGYRMNHWEIKQAIEWHDVFGKAVNDGYPLAVALNYALNLGEHCRMDLHVYNTMARPGTGDLVITDPVHG